MIVRDIQTTFQIPDWVQPTLFAALDPEDSHGPGCEQYVYGHHVITTYFEPGFLNLKNLTREELQEVFNFLCIFHPVGKKIMAGIPNGEPRRFMNQLCRACALLLDEFE